MSAIAIITDTDASLPADVAAKYGIRQVSINVHFGEETLATGPEINDAQLFARVDREGKLPTTSAPSPGQFSMAFENALDQGAEQIVCFCVSSEVSATYGAAVVARDTLPDADITVVDTRSLTMGQGFMVLAAAEAAAQGASADELVAQALNVGQRIHIYAALSTVKYMAMSGRIGSLAAGMATLLNVKPVLAVQDGKLDLLERVRTKKKSWARVIELTAEAVGEQPIERMAIVHANAAEEARQFAEQVDERLSCPEDVITAELTPGLSVHSGAGLVGIAAVAGIPG
jgi:DegV family protein with EDD domain